MKYNMKNTTIDTVIVKFSTLKEDDQVFAFDLLKKIVAESRRNSIATRAKKATANFKTGKVKSGNINELFNDLEND